MKYFIHKKSIVKSKKVGEGTNIWAFCNILEGARIGKNCNICDFCFIENEVSIGDNATIKNGVYLFDGTKIENDVFVGPNVTFTNDRFPRSKNSKFKKMGITLKKGSSIGANSTLLPGVTIGEYAMVGAGSVVTKDVASNSLVIGNPAKFVRKVKKIEFSKK